MVTASSGQGVVSAARSRKAGSILGSLKVVIVAPCTLRRGHGEAPCRHMAALFLTPQAPCWGFESPGVGTSLPLGLGIPHSPARLLQTTSLFVAFLGERL